MRTLRFGLVLLVLVPACENSPTVTGTTQTNPESHTAVAATGMHTSSTTTVTTPPGSQTVGHVRVLIKKVSVGKVPLKQADGSVQYADEPRLMIALRIENVNDQKRSEYSTWVPDLDAAKTVAKVSDDQGHELKRITFGFGNNVQGRTVLDTLTPGRVISDLLVFEAPPTGTKSLKLVLPGANCGVRGTFEFDIDAATIAGAKAR
jgi:hypothetical protein